MIIEAMKQAIEALEMYISMDTHDEAHILEVDIAPKAITALRTAIAEAEKQEPVAWAVVGDGEHGEYEVGQMLEKKSEANFEYWEARGYSLVPLYTTPPAAQRQPLTDEKIWLEYQRFWPFHPAEEPRLAKDIAKFARAIEAAHGIKDGK